jgi:hypothetical protein
MRQKQKGETFNLFGMKAYKRYVLFMVLKFEGEYTSNLDEPLGFKPSDIENTTH